MIAFYEDRLEAMKLEVRLGWAPQLRLASQNEAGAEKKKPQLAITNCGFLLRSLTVPYFHERKLTIIGAKSFHGPVRDGKGWDRLAMVIRLNLYEWRSLVRTAFRIWRK